jgi:hypothetical protein
MSMNIVVRNARDRRYMRVALKKQEVVSRDIGFEYIPNCRNMNSADNWVTRLSA